MVNVVKVCAQGKATRVNRCERESDAWQWIDDNKHLYPGYQLKLEFEY